MQYFRNVLVGVQLPRGEDTNEPLAAPTQAVIEQALDLAERTKAQVTFCTVINPDGGLFSSSTTDKLRNVLSQAARDLHASLQQIAADRSVEADSVIREGKAWAELAIQVVEGGHDALIVGTRDPSISSYLFGSTGKKLLRCVPCPLWLVRPGDSSGEIPEWLVAAGLDDVSLNAMHMGVNGAQIFESRLHILHAVGHGLDRRLSHTGLTTSEIETLFEETRRQRENEIRQQLSTTDYRTVIHGVNVHVVDGPPEVCVLQAVDEYNIDLVIMGTQARGGISGMLLGNTAERLVAELDCSLLAIKPDEFVCDFAESSQT